VSDWTLNGHPVLGAELMAPLAGRWTATVEVDTTEALTGAAELRIGGVAWRGYVFRGGLDEASDVWRGRIVGGAGGLDRVVAARSWRGLQPARGLLTELLTEVGEALAPDSGAEVDANLARWSRVDGPAHRALAFLAGAVGARWRVRPDGAVWVGAETWPELFEPEGALTELLSTDPATGAAAYSLSGGYVLPGQTWQGRRVAGVVYRLDGGRDRAAVWWVDGG
jgi:hypothetical protein